ncbi:prepilin peptidase [Anaeromyxobacter terrae]|uniref:prepilin peptidase n=1 Tax=Anaeromyxobacter terrae TaxID=2925406 RepID=UPI001F598579|nr:A24 family peptidase [Anaeromyxobacter sp. SG22]
MPPDASVPPVLAAAWFTVLGAVLGSFLNVVIARVPAGLSIVRPGSRCPRCGRPIAWYDNVPVLSWLVLRGRCRGCALPISIRYPLVELLGAAAGYLAWRRHGVSADAGTELALVLALLALAFIDLDTWLLPHAITWPLLGAGVLASALGWSPAPSLASSLRGAAAGWGTFALLSWGGEKVLRKEALGFGDVWLLGGLGAWLGLGALLPVVLLASVQGSVVGIALVLLGKGETGERPLSPGAEVAPAEGEAPGGEAEPRLEAPLAELPPAEAEAEAEPDATAAAPPGPGDGQSTPAAEHPSADEDWIPPRNAVPFGPFLALGALEWLYGAALLARAFPALGAFR